MVDVCDRSDQVASCELWCPRPRPEAPAEAAVKAEMNGQCACLQGRLLTSKQLMAQEKPTRRGQPVRCSSDAVQPGEEQASAPVVKLESNQ
eukprot:415463-Hanusia_phi.AAC.3